MTCQAQTWNTKLLKKNLQNTSRQYTESAEYQKRFLNVLQGNIEWILCWIRMRACNVYTFRSGTWNYVFAGAIPRNWLSGDYKEIIFPWFIFCFSVSYTRLLNKPTVFLIFPLACSCRKCIIPLLTGRFTTSRAWIQVDSGEARWIVSRYDLAYGTWSIILQNSRLI